MFIEIDPSRLRNALAIVKKDLLAAREPEGHWVGELSSSPTATAAAICALVIAEQYGSLESHGRKTDELFDSDQIFQGDLSELIVGSLHWLADQQNDDGGWGDTDKSNSNIATTMLVVAAFRLTGVPAKNGNLLAKAERFIKSRGGPRGLRKSFGNDKTYSAPILACCALAGLVPWKEVRQLPFELVCVPRSWWRVARPPVISQAIPALVAVGQAKFFTSPQWNPVTRFLRLWAAPQSLKIVGNMQSESGGFLEATPLTSFVVMCLASIGHAEHPIVRQGVEFLLSAVRPDGSWPIGSNLATSNTSRAFLAILSHDQESQITNHDIEGLDWLLDCQHVKVNPVTGETPGGWGWTEQSGAVPDAVDTACALRALAAWRRRAPSIRQIRVENAARSGVRWLLSLQNRDGGWPTFRKGWNKLRFDQSACDPTADAVRTLNGWREIWNSEQDTELREQGIAIAIDRGFTFLAREQQVNGSWLPLWFGNQHNQNYENPVVGSARVLNAFCELGRHDSDEARRGAAWLASAQHASGGWGVISKPKVKNPDRKRRPSNNGELEIGPPCSVEETAMAVSALVAYSNAKRDVDTEAEAALIRGVDWLMSAVESGDHRVTTPIGLFTTNTWYHEKLYPVLFTAEALNAAANHFAGSSYLEQTHSIEAETETISAAARGRPK